MKQILIFGCSLVLALIVMDTNQVVKTSLGLAVKGGQAYAADMPPPMAPRLRLRQSAKGRRLLAKARARGKPRHRS